jgi:HEAT repeat protein
MLLIFILVSKSEISALRSLQPLRPLKPLYNIQKTANYNTHQRYLHKYLNPQAKSKLKVMNDDDDAMDRQFGQAAAITSGQQGSPQL